MNELAYQIAAYESIGRDGKSVWTAEHPELPGCVATGGSPEESVERLEDARNAWLKVARELGVEIPVPSFEDVMITYTYVARPNTSRYQTAAAEEEVRIQGEVAA